MTDSNKQKELQQELFEEFSAPSQKPERLAPLSRGHQPILISTNIEQLLLAGILLILALCGIFFLGVLRGKALPGGILASQNQSTQPPTMKTQPARPVSVTQKSAARQNIAITSRSAAASLPPSNTAPAKAMPTSASLTLPAQKPYTIQLVTHRKREFAENEMNAIRAQGLYSFLIPSGEYYQVCVGQYASKEEAKRDLSRFLAKYKDCFLRRR